MPEYSPTKVRPRQGWVVVLDDQRKTTLASGLILPNHETGAEKVSEGTGTIVRLGGGIKTELLGLEEGQKVLYRGFLKYANPFPTEETWENGEQKRYFIMSVDDIVGVLAPGVEAGVFSGRPTNPERI